MTIMADVDDLKTTFEQVVGAICRRDAGAYSNFWHEQIVAFPPFSPFAVEGKSTLRQMAEANFAQNESVTFSPINPQCRVIGSTGIVWGHTALTRKPKDGPLTTLFARFTFCEKRRAVARGRGSRIATANCWLIERKWRLCEAADPSSAAPRR
jgi:ketosteroid isomerase-like protein